MKWVDFVRGTVRLRVTGAYPQQFLNRMAQQGTPFWEITRPGELQLETTVYRSDLPRCRQAAERAMCELETLRQSGLRARFYGLRRRPVLLVGLLLVVALALWSEQYIWTLDVEGNETVPAQEILRTLAELGVGVGTKWQTLDPQRLENRMLDRMPALSWFTINANSARAHVLVRERVPVPELVDTRQPTNVVAAKTGMIETMEVYDGQAVVEPGQMVQAGQLLVSGLTTPFRTTVLHHAMAEVYARTWYDIRVLSTRETAQKCYTGGTETLWRLRVGNKLMKLSGNSGIYPGEYDKIVTTYPLTLPGGITLPVSLERVTLRYYTLEHQPQDEAALRDRVLADSLQWLRGEMVAGQIRSAADTLTDEGNRWSMEIHCECTEQIGVLSPIYLDTKEDERG